MKLQAEACNFIKKETQAQMFSCELCEIFNNTFFTEHLWTTASDFQEIYIETYKTYIWNLLVCKMQILRQS